MDYNKIVPMLGKDIKDIESTIKNLSAEIAALNEKLGSFKKTYSMLCEANDAGTDKDLNGNGLNGKAGNESKLPAKDLKIKPNYNSLDKNNRLLEEKETDMAREITKETIKVIQLKNGQVNIPYEDIVILEEFNIPKDSIIEFEGIEQLKWNQKETKFEGNLIEHGEYNGVLSFWENAQDKENGKPKLERLVHILINPDPRTLWNDIDPPDGPYFKPNNAFALEKVGTRKVVGASVRGKSHAHKGTFRDDHFEIDQWENNDWVLQVVSDGAGSAEFSREGSKIACNSVYEKISEFLKDSTKLNDFESKLAESYSEENEDDDGNLPMPIRDLIYELTVQPAYFAHSQIKAFAENEGKSIKEFSSTLLFALSKKFDFGKVVITFSIGDGAIGVIAKEKGYILMDPDGGEFSGQTRFVTMSNVFDQTVYNRVNFRLFKENVDAIILMSDGISDPKFGTDLNLRESDKWIELWSELKPILTKEEVFEKEVFEWMDFYEKGEYDDRTLTILY